MVGWVGRLVLVNDVDEGRAVGEGEDVGREGETSEEGEEEFHIGLCCEGFRFKVKAYLLKVL
jgi:hypothetical protein